MRAVGFITTGLLWTALAAGIFPVKAATNGFRFKLPEEALYIVDTASPATTVGIPSRQRFNPAPWLSARGPRGGDVAWGQRLVVQLRSGGGVQDLQALIAGTTLELDRSFAENTFVLEAPDAWTAAQEASRLAQLSIVAASYPIMKRPRVLHGPYAPRPNDSYFPLQWYLENRSSNHVRLGPDLNVRAAWPFTRGEGIIIAVADDGIEVTHPELRKAMVGSPHFNFFTSKTNVSNLGSAQIHATSVAGLAAAQGENSQGIQGVASRARLASWLIFGSDDSIVSDESLADMFQHKQNQIDIQNHSWGNAGFEQLGPSLLESIAISNAVTHGRSGRGVIIVRSGGNGRERGGSSNDDGYPDDPRAIAVAAVRSDGRVTSYSNPGSCLLVAAPSGDLDAEMPDGSLTNYPTLFTTDRQGGEGYNTGFYTNDLANYAFDDTGFSGTSGSAPQISGVAALILSANTNLHYRDVQQILLLSARHFDLLDPDLGPNGAGLQVSHNQGFGVPDAGEAVRLARSWSNRPSLTNVIMKWSGSAQVPDEGRRMVVSGPVVPSRLRSIRYVPGQGLQPDPPRPRLPLVEVGLVTNGILQDVQGKAALIQRGDIFFSKKIQRAADAGAVMAVIYNDKDSDALVTMDATEFSPIPAVFIGQNDGEALRAYLQQASAARAEFLIYTNFSFDVSATVLCEHVGLKVKSDHPRRGDLRITLVSPQGTRSILQRVNNDTAPGPDNWTYYSTHHFLESSAGRWTCYVSDERTGEVGNISVLSLIIQGVSLADTDRDGLDDEWESAYFGNLEHQPLGDEDDDGFQNSREQVMGTHPLVIDIPFTTDLSLWDNNFARLSWPGKSNYNYEVYSGVNAANTLVLITNIPGQFPVTEFYTPITNATQRFFNVQARHRGN